MNKKYFWLLILIFILQSCGAYFNQPYKTEKARLGEATNTIKKLKSLPLPEKPIVVGVYKFRDQTGQYKPSDNGSTFSTAVTQGATTILIKALEDSRWFTPIERENFSNLTNERNIIRSTRKQYSTASGTNQPSLPPLLYAGILLEGGVVSYDSNIITGGAGARYFGAGGSTQYRQDRITVYLRAVSTSNGKILKTIYVSKTLLSQAVDASLFRYVSFKRLLEVETGFTKNEPSQIAVTEAIEKAVESLIIEGINDGLWASKAAKKDVAILVNNYAQEKDEALSTEIYGRLLTNRRTKHAFTTALGASYIDGDLPNAEVSLNSKLGYKFYLSNHLNLNLSYNVFNLSNNNLFKENFVSSDLNLEYSFLPLDKLSPYVFGGIGITTVNFSEQDYVKLQFGLGIEYLIYKKVGIHLYIEHNATFTDNLDLVEAGSHSDLFYRAGIGLNIYLGKSKNKL
ncbi:hypothetical protein K8354_04780 [Polaribacter litorisediminis]|uniref:CsgG/HfaB family protein n=1 Tax=Polaribacter litorisediminis TaxID=1908341 RepID=UPI001CBD2E58|nr:CsgG/HfaB family protein [Polaribacter litorisediminis]UAM99141.1 hypothetical protein K8354_04780 [Polaribacter litorisediminis]